jgi:hypothetical protein
VALLAGPEGCGLYTSGCLCPPGRDRDHACVSGCTLWVEGPEGLWWRVEAVQSIHKAKEWLAICDTWLEVCEALELATLIDDPLGYQNWRLFYGLPL